MITSDSSVLTQFHSLHLQLRLIKDNINRLARAHLVNIHAVLLVCQRHHDPLGDVGEPPGQGIHRPPASHLRVRGWEGGGGGGRAQHLREREADGRYEV